MPRAQIKTLLFFLLIAFLSSCNDSEEILITENTQEIDEVAVDSLLQGLSDRELYFQHLIFEIPSEYQSHKDSIIAFIIENQPGGIQLMNWDIENIEHLYKTLDTLNIIQPLVFIDAFEFLGMEPYPYWLANDTLVNSFYAKALSSGKQRIVNFSSSKNLGDQSFFDTLISRNGIIPVIGNYDDKNIKNDFKTFINQFENSQSSFILGIQSYDTLDFESFKSAHNHKGFLISQSHLPKTNNLLKNGFDFVKGQFEIEREFEKWNKEFKSTAFMNSTASILKFKRKIVPDVKPVNLSSNKLFLSSNIQFRATSLLNNANKFLPLSAKFSIYAADGLGIQKSVLTENGISVFKKEINAVNITKIANEKGDKVILLPDSVSQEMMSTLKQITKANNTVICFSDPLQQTALNELPYLVFVPRFNNLNHAILVQQLAGKLPINGNFISADTVIRGKEIKGSGLARSIPEFVGMSSDSLKQIDYAVNTAMNGRAFPGCQVLIAKNGTIIYDKSFGYHSYKREKLVNSESMYDLASITKVVATTLVGMKLYEANAYSLNDSLSKYLPDSLKFHLKYPSTIRNITFQELFIHESGLPSGFPIINYMQYTNSEIGRLDKYYCDVKDSTYNIEVAEGFYMEKVYADSMWLRLNRIFLDPVKPYKYSDVSMNTLYYMFSSIIGNRPRDFGFTDPAKKLAEKNLFEEYLYNNFYKPLEMNRTRYKPLRFFTKNQIVPTEDEKYWRRQLLQGSVHDPNAALMGGIAGNAGMYSTANDLVKLLQMLLNKGEFEGKRYLKPETVTKFTSAQPGSHRGLGWNKPTLTSTGYGISDYATLQTFGHTGFTGTCIWVDPASGLIYIFLANRVHPDVNNRIYQFGIRKRIHQTAYQSLIFESYSRNY